MRDAGQQRRLQHRAPRIFVGSVAALQAAMSRAETGQGESVKSVAGGRCGGAGSPSGAGRPRHRQLRPAVTGARWRLRGTSIPVGAGFVPVPDADPERCFSRRRDHEPDALRPGPSLENGLALFSGPFFWPLFPGQSLPVSRLALGAGTRLTLSPQPQALFWFGLLNTNWLASLSVLKSISVPSR